MQVLPSSVQGLQGFVRSPESWSAGDCGFVGVRITFEVSYLTFIAAVPLALLGAAKYPRDALPCTSVLGRGHE
jgi:hypothetical protein